MYLKHTARKRFVIMTIYYQSVNKAVFYLRKVLHKIVFDLNLEYFGIKTRKLIQKYLPLNMTQ